MGKCNLGNRTHAPVLSVHMQMVWWVLHGCCWAVGTVCGAVPPYHTQVFIPKALKVCKPHPFLDAFRHQRYRLLKRHDHVPPVAFWSPVSHHAVAGIHDWVLPLRETDGMKVVRVRRF